MSEVEKDRRAAESAGLSESQVILTAEAVLAGVNAMMPADLTSAASLDDLRTILDDALAYYRLIGGLVGDRKSVKVLREAVALQVVNSLLPTASPRIENIEALRGTLADGHVVEAFAGGSLSVVQFLDAARRVVTPEQWRSIASDLSVYVGRLELPDASASLPCGALPETVH